MGVAACEPAQRLSPGRPQPPPGTWGARALRPLPVAGSATNQEHKTIGQDSAAACKKCAYAPCRFSEGKGRPGQRGASGRAQMERRSLTGHSADELAHLCGLQVFE